MAILRDNSGVLVRPLTLILKQLFEQAIFPEILQILEVSPIHKQEDFLTVSNCRPISL